MNYHALIRAIGDGGADRSIPAMCVRTLTGIVDGDVPVRAVRHPLGFFCLPVQRLGDLGVCVHVWTSRIAAAVPTTSLVHCHSWDLLSFVLYGAVGNASMNVLDDPVRGTHRVFEVHSRDAFDEIRATGRLVRCVERSRRVTGPRATYRLRAGEFHASVLGADTEAATVVLGRGGGTRDLSLGPPDTPSHRVARRLCDAEETATAARIVIDALANTIRM